MRLWASIAIAVALLGTSPAVAAAPSPAQAAYDAAVARYGATDVPVPRGVGPSSADTELSQ